MKKLSNKKIPFGLKKGTLVDVSEVESGLECGCVCPSCKRSLQANKGKIVSHYFSHNPSMEKQVCESGFETSIHLMAKQILSEDGYCTFPSLTIRVSKSDLNGNVHVEERQLEQEIKRTFEKVQLEKRLEKIRPDIVSYIDDVPFLIEVAVTSFSDAGKKQIIRNLGLPAIEIDLSSVDYKITKVELRKLIHSTATKKEWISNPKAIRVKKELNEKLDEKIRQENENIYRNRNLAKTQERQTYQPSPKRIARISHDEKKETTTQFDIRWFLCEKCRYLFEMPCRDVSYMIESIPCPSCNYAVSTKS